MRLFFIRHGQTTGDVEDRYGGAYDDGLSVEGFEQARILADELAGQGITQVVTSGLLRARQTGEILAGGLGIGSASDTRLNERNQYGVLTGMVKADAKRDYPELVEQLKDRLFTAPGAESYEDFRDRITAAFNAITSGTAVIWHGGGMRVLFRDILKVGELAAIGDCCWVELERQDTGWRVIEMKRVG